MKINLFYNILNIRPNRKWSGRVEHWWKFQPLKRHSYYQNAIASFATYILCHDTWFFLLLFWFLAALLLLQASLKIPLYQLRTPSCVFLNIYFAHPGYFSTPSGKLVINCWHGNKSWTQSDYIKWNKFLRQQQQLLSPVSHLFCRFSRINLDLIFWKNEWHY